MSLEFLFHPRHLGRTQTAPLSETDAETGDSSLIDQLETPLRVLGLLGGLGYGWRRALGSLQWSGGSLGPAPLTFDQYRRHLHALLDGMVGRHPPSQDSFAVLSAQTGIRLKRFPPDTRPDAILIRLTKAVEDTLANTVRNLPGAPNGPIAVANFFSERHGSVRNPSPYLFHIHKCTDASVLVATHLPRHRDSAGLTRDFASLFHELGMVGAPLVPGSAQ